jgi:hypothetical protein
MRVRFLLATFALIACMACANTSAAQSPFAGTWKLNQEKSQLAGDTMKFGPAAEQSIELTTGGITYSFRTDGKPYALPSGDVAIWRQNSPSNWTTEYRTINNKLLSSDDWQLSADGKTLTITSTGAKANGDLYTNTATYTRTDGASGLMGAWKSTAVKLSSPNELTIQVAGLDRLIFKIAAMKATCEANFDGREVAVDGPDIPSGLRLSLNRVGPYSFKLTQKLNGKLISSSVYSVTKDDPNTMTEVGGAPGDPPATVIWERQAPATAAAPAAAPGATPNSTPAPPAPAAPAETPTVGVPVRP